MKKLNYSLIGAAVLLTSLQTLANDCDATKTARQAVKAIVAIEDIKGITAYYGGVKDSDSLSTTIDILPYFEKTKDWYSVKVRNSDCKILSTALIAEHIPQ